MSVTSGIGATELVISGIAVGASVGNVLALLLFLFFFLLGPHLVDVQQLNGDKVAFKSTVAVLATTDEDVGIEVISGHISVRTVLFVDTQNTSDQLSVAKECR